MAKLFKDKLIKQKLENFEIPDLEGKIGILKNWYNLSENKTLTSKKEEEIEGPFGDDIFGKVLEYQTITENDTYNRKFQPKVPEGGQKADIGLGFFSTEKDIMKVVVELKDAKTSLDKPQQRAGNLTPVQQAFKYKPYFKECDFIIVSNFYETRLYIDSYYDYEAWTLTDLVNPKDNYFNFRRFYYLLSKNNLIAKRGESNTKSLLSLIRVQEKEITKQFYKEYTILRKELFKDIVKNNPGFKKTELDFLLNKTQKIIDRIIFIHFCEDLDLLPQGKLKEVIEFGEQSLATVWQTLCNFFRAVDSGSDKLGIPDGYNGGLFHTDEELNALKVGDEICKKFVDMGEYDFADDLSVNILGHIFEQSISDIEELKDKINKQEEATLSKRKKDGVFYTPEYIVDYIVKNSVGKKIDDWEEELKFQHNLKEDITDKNYTKRAIQVYEALQEKLANIKVLDPACGSGAFLVKVFDFLLDKNKEIAKKLEELGVNQGLFSSESYFKSILQNNIYGVDLNEESVEITKLSLWLKTAQKGKKLANLDQNIKCGNSLIDDPAIAGNKAFKWEEEFSEIFADGGFDVIVGNPPYVRRTQLPNDFSKFLEENYFSGNGQFDLYILFNELAIKILKQDGVVAYIQPNKFLSASYGINILNLLVQNTKILSIYNVSLDKVFSEASVYPYIFVFQKKGYSLPKSITDISIFSQKEIDFIGFERELNSVEIIGKIKNKSISLSTVTNKIRRGIPSTKVIENVDEGDFAIKSTLLEYGYYQPKSNIKISYLNDEFGVEKKEEFGSEFILLPRTVLNIRASLKDDFSHILDRIYYFNSSNKAFPNKYILSVLNSSISTFYYDYKFGSTKIGGGYIDLKGSQIADFLIPNISLSEQAPFIEKADFMLDTNKELSERVNRFLKRLQGTFELEKLSKKLQKFYELEFAEFVKELKKAKITLSLKDQDEWEEYFESYKAEIVEIKSKIDACDREIDEMVFDLYGLSEEEREVVLSS